MIDDHLIQLLLTSCYVHQVRYNKGLKHPVKKNRCTILLSWCNRYRWQCSGVKGCEHLHPDLQAFEHSKVDDDLLNHLESLPQSIRDQFPQNGEQCYVIKSQSTRRTTCGSYVMILWPIGGARDRFLTGC